MIAQPQVHVWWRPAVDADGAEVTGGGPQPAGWEWPAGVPLPEVGDRLRAPEGASPLDRGTVVVESRTWEVGRDMYGARGFVVVLRLDCRWWVADHRPPAPAVRCGSTFPRVPLGPRCQLDAGHPGDHLHDRGDGVEYSW